MKRALLIPMLLVAGLTLGGCESISKFRDITSVITTPIANPISLNESYKIEAAYAAILVPVRAYFRLRQCRASETASISNPCSRYAVKVKIQNADLKLRAVLIPFRHYIKNNQTVTALSAATAVWSAINEYKLVLANNGVTK